MANGQPRNLSAGRRARLSLHDHGVDVFEFAAVSNILRLDAPRASFLGVSVSGFTVDRRYTQGLPGIVSSMLSSRTTNCEIYRLSIR